MRNDFAYKFLSCTLIVSDILHNIEIILYTLRQMNILLPKKTVVPHIVKEVGKILLNIFLQETGKTKQKKLFRSIDFRC